MCCANGVHVNMFTRTIAIYFMQMWPCFLLCRTPPQCGGTNFVTPPPIKERERGVRFYFPPLVIYSTLPLVVTNEHPLSFDNFEFLESPVTSGDYWLSYKYSSEGKPFHFTIQSSQSLVVRRWENVTKCCQTESFFNGGLANLKTPQSKLLQLGHFCKDGGFRAIRNGN